MKKLNITYILEMEKYVDDDLIEGFVGEEKDTEKETKMFYSDLANQFRAGFAVQGMTFNKMIIKHKIDDREKLFEYEF